MGKKSLFPVLVGVVYVNVDVSFWLFRFLFYFFSVFSSLSLLLFFAKNLQLSQHTLRTFSNDHVIPDLIFFCSALWITLGALFGMAVIWALLTCITRYVTDTLIAIFRKKAASSLAVQFHADPPPWSNWHFKLLVFEEEETRTTRRKTLDEGDSKHCWKTSVLSIASSLLPTFVLMLIKEIKIYMANWASEENENCVSDWFLKVPMK